MKRITTMNSLQRPYLSTLPNHITNTQESCRISAKNLKTSPVFLFFPKIPFDFLKEKSASFLKEPVKKPGFFKKIDWFSFIKKEKKSLVKKTFMNIWISDVFPMHFKQLSPILTYLSSENLMLSKLNQVLNTEVFIREM